MQKNKEKFNFLVNLGKIFSKNKINFLPIKFYDKDYDVDVVVGEKKFLLAQKILEKNGFIPERSLISRIKEPEKKFFHSGGKFSVHLHSKISWYGIEYINFKNVWERKIKIKNLFFPSESDEILIMAAHSIFENRRITKEQRNYFSKARKKVDWNYVLSSAKKYNWNLAFKIFLKKMNSKTNSYSFRELFAAYTSKFIYDLFKARFLTLPRQIIVYTFFLLRRCIC